MKHIVRALGVGLAGFGLLASATLSASAAPAKLVPDGRSAGVHQVAAASAADSAGERISVMSAAAEPVTVRVWATCISSPHFEAVGGLWIEAVNNTDVAQTLTVAVTEINEFPVSADWDSVPLSGGQTLETAFVLGEEGEQPVGDGMAIRFWDASSPGGEWDAMLSLPDCVNGDPFTDSYFFGDQFGMEIDWMFQSGTSTGWIESDHTRTYRGLQSMNRDAMAAFLYRMAGKPAFTAPAKPSFKDVATSNPYYKEIEWLKSTGITTGWADGTFRPWTPVARDAMAAFLYRFSVYQGEPTFTPEPDTYVFEDVPIGTQHFDAIYWMAMTGISTGWQVGAEDWEYRPLNDVKRDAIAAFMFRYTDLVSRP